MAFAILIGSTIHSVCEDSAEKRLKMIKAEEVKQDDNAECRRGMYIANDGSSFSIFKFTFCCVETGKEVVAYIPYGWDSEDWIWESLDASAVPAHLANMVSFYIDNYLPV